MKNIHEIRSKQYLFNKNHLDENSLLSLLLKSLGDILKSQQHQLHVSSNQRKVQRMWRSVSLRGNHSFELMNKDELAFLRIHHRSCISRAHLSEHKRSWNAHNGPALPSIKTNEMGEGSLWRYHNSLCFETRVGLAFDAIFYKWSPCYYVDMQNQWRNSIFNLLGLGNYRNDSPLTTQTHCFKTHGTVLSSSFGNSKKWETKPLKVIFRRTSFTHKMPDASHLALTPAMHEPGSP